MSIYCIPTKNGDSKSAVDEYDGVTLFSYHHEGLSATNAVWLNMIYIVLAALLAIMPKRPLEELIAFALRSFAVSTSS